MVGAAGVEDEAFSSEASGFNLDADDLTVGSYGEEVKGGAATEWDEHVKPGSHEGGEHSGLGGVAAPDRFHLPTVESSTDEQTFPIRCTNLRNARARSSAG